jgi:hypothetical protein
MKAGIGWTNPGNNFSGFFVQPKGYLHVDGTASAVGSFMGYWTSTSTSTDGAAAIIFEDTLNQALLDPADLKTLGYGCRCVKDAPGQPGNCLKIPIVIHILKCSDSPLHEINNVDISPIYDQITYLNNLFQFPGYCIEFYLACQNTQTVFEVHDICDGTFAIDPARYVHADDTMRYGPGYIRNQVVTAIQTDQYEWSADRYLNVYIAVTYNGAISAFPGSPLERSAIVMPIEWIGGEEVAYEPLDIGRTMSLAHEIGHFFGLNHPWSPADLDSLFFNGQIECAGINNGIADVATFYGNVFADTVFSCATSQPMYNDNIMSYSKYGVATVFTNGQIQHMQTVLSTPHALNGRAELVRMMQECD